MIEQVSHQAWRGTFPADDASMRRARQFVAAVLDSWGAPLSEDVELLTSEAVTNSYLHADTADVTVEVTRNASMVHIAVHDDDPVRPVLRTDPVPGTGGFGMRLIQGLADDWGVVEIAGDGKIVWFEVELAGSTPGPVRLEHDQRRPDRPPARPHR
ncbi:ATP-binding protein [Aquihabitans daechungensis]|uniref:ATP-binding protein n=1 Tax=Aquihabitans daechungensis TaxID=1052257 RepID=UPI003B9F1782